MKCWRGGPRFAIGLTAISAYGEEEFEGWSAAIEVFIPLAAVVIGITLFGIIKDLVVS